MGDVNPCALQVERVGVEQRLVDIPEGILNPLILAGREEKPSDQLHPIWVEKCEVAQ